MFYFAWVDKSETTFGPEHEREDENVFSFNLTHAEGDFAALSIEIVNPRMGLLGPTRKQWAWLSYRTKQGEVVPLFFGRLLGVPQDIQANIVALMLVARPQDYEEQKAALADAMRVLPYFDPVFLGEEAQTDPDAVLEGYSKLWHIDRVTHELTASEFVAPASAAPLIFGDGNGVYRESVSVSHGQSPARKVVLTAKAAWTQSAAGSFDITHELLTAFKQVTPPGVATISGMEAVTEGMINVVCGEDLLEKWPVKGDAIGSGWSFGETHMWVVGGYPLPPTIVDAKTLTNVANRTYIESAAGNAMRTMFERTPGISVQVVAFDDRSTAVRNPVNNGQYTRIGSFDILWVPVYRMAATMEVAYGAARERSEALTLSMSADVQPLLSDPSDEETIVLDVGAANVDVPINGVVPLASLRSNRYFDTDRGRASMEHLMLRARAALIARARAVDITFSFPFEEGLHLSCRDVIELRDDRLPEGRARGKVKQYALTADGNSGVLTASVMIGCAVGKNGTPETAEGEPTYVEEGYADEGYQVYLGSEFLSSSGDFSWSDYALYPIEDDGVDLGALDNAYGLKSISVIGGLQKEVEEVQNPTGGPFSTGVEVMDRVSGATTTLRIEMLPLAGGPFDTVLQVQTNSLCIPRGVNLEAD